MARIPELPWLLNRWGGWQHVVLRDPCVYCYQPSTTIEHVRAVFGRSGRRRHAFNHEWIVGACRQCNNDKGPMPLLMYLTLRQLRANVTLNRERQANGLPAFSTILKRMRNPDLWRRPRNRERYDSHPRLATDGLL